VLHGNQQVMFHSDRVIEQIDHLRKCEWMFVAVERGMRLVLQLHHYMRFVAADMVVRPTIAMTGHAAALEPL